jgi:predicted transcriptional regulator
MADENNDDFKALVAQVAAAYFANSHVGPSEIPSVIEQIAQSLAPVGAASAQASSGDGGIAPEQRLTRGQIRKSITPDALISFEDGKGYKTLRRHLAVKGLTPAQYREKWGLPQDYPMTAPSYSEARSQMAKQLGLGNKRRTAASPTKAPASRRRKAAPPTAE